MKLGRSVIFGLGCLFGAVVAGGAISWMLWRKSKRQLAELEDCGGACATAGSAKGILKDLHGDPDITDEESRDDALQE